MEPSWFRWQHLSRARLLLHLLEWSYYSTTSNTSRQRSEGGCAPACAASPGHSGKETALISFTASFDHPRSQL